MYPTVGALTVPPESITMSFVQFSKWCHSSCFFYANSRQCHYAYNGLLFNQHLRTEVTLAISWQHCNVTVHVAPSPLRLGHHVPLSSSVLSTTMAMVLFWYPIVMKTWLVVEKNHGLLTGYCWEYWWKHVLCLIWLQTGKSNCYLTGWSWGNFGEARVAPEFKSIHTACSIR